MNFLYGVVIQFLLMPKWIIPIAFPLSENVLSDKRMSASDLSITKFVSNVLLISSQLPFYFFPHLFLLSAMNFHILRVILASP